MNAPLQLGRIIKDIMALIPVYFNIEDEPSKALVMDDKVEFYLKLGAKRTPQEVKAQIANWLKEIVKDPTEDEVKLKELVEPKQENIDGDKGSGEPNSSRFHDLKLKELYTFEMIQDYTFKVTGKMIRRGSHGKISQYRRNALRLIRGHINGNQSR